MTKYRNFSKILTKIEIFRNFDRNRYFSKCWPESKILFKSKFFEHLTKIRNFSKFFFKNWAKSKFSKIWPNSKFVENCYQNRNFFEILIRIENFDKNRNCSKIWLKSKFSKIWPNFKFFENFIRIEDFR